MLNDNFFNQIQDVKALFRGYGSFGEIHGTSETQGRTLSHKTDMYQIQCTYEQDPYGVISRKDTFRNCGKEPLNVRCLKSRFVFEGGEYQVYTQFNCWQTESSGAWQDLNTTISVSGPSSRTTEHGAPFLALWSEQEQRGVAFHLLPNAAWEMKITRAHKLSKYTNVVVELGILDYHFDVRLDPGEELAMPQILCYEFTSKVQMDAHKLHNYMHTNYPRREMPIIYDTWMCCFDHFTYDTIAKQVPLAADLGVEYFFIDAGWFGKGKSWSRSVGDWSENMTGAFCGRMKELADLVRSHGMQFGLWLEPERAVPDSDSVKAHPEYYIPGDVASDYCFLDFANPEARRWMLGVIFDLIERYGIGYIKDDYNADMYFDIHNSAFYRYQEGHKQFIAAIRERHPNLYLSSCASGGERMDLTNYIRFDSAWPSDNESPHTQFRIYKDTLLRLPPQGFERWAAIHSLCGFEPFYKNFGGGEERTVACGDAVWKHIIGVQDSFLDGFMTGGPIGLSCDLSLFSEQLRNHVREFIGEVKANRDFWIKAVARRLCDTPTVTILQYSDMDLSRIVVQFVTHETQQDHFTAWPAVDENKWYLENGKTIRSGRDIVRNGIHTESPFWADNWHEMYQVTLTEVPGENERGGK